LNIHPSLLPKYGGKGFFGLNVHQAVIDNKEKVTGCSIHIVTEEYDEGPVLAQSKVDVLPSDTPEILAKRVLLKEHELYPKVIQQFLSSKILIS
jgi:phosphoribosylglycinamide formyltransferase-1